MRRGVGLLGTAVLTLGLSGVVLSQAPTPAGASGTPHVRVASYNGDRTWQPVNVCFTATYTHTISNAQSSTTFVNGPGSPPDGIGSVRLHTDIGTCGASIRNSTEGHVKLATLTALSYSTYDSSNNGSQFPFLNLDINLDTVTGATTPTRSNDTLFFEPPYQTKANGGTKCATEGTEATTTWQQWTALHGCWWDNDGLLGDFGGYDGVGLIATLLALFPNAYIVNYAQPFTGTPGFAEGGVGVTVGYATSGAVFTGNVGGVTVGTAGGTTRYDFEGPVVVTPTPNSHTVPAAISLSATGFDPTAGTVSCHFTSGAPATSATLSFGGLTGLVASGTIALTSADAVGSNPISCSQTDYNARVLRGTGPFTVDPLALTYTCTTSSSPPTCTLTQNVSTTIIGSNLSLSEVRDTTPTYTGAVNPTKLSVVLSTVRLGQRATNPVCRGTHPSQICNTSAFAAADGHLNTVVVNDDRGTLTGWTVTGQLLSTFEGPLVGFTHTIPADYLTWAPAVSALTTSCVTLNSVQVCGPSDLLTQVNPGTAAHLSKSTATLLCEAPSGGGGGGTKCTATLDLAVPPYIAAGHYAATLDIVVS